MTATGQRIRAGVGGALAAFGLVAVLVLTVFPDPEQIGQAALTPLWCLVCGPAGAADVLHNLLLFVPLGAGLRLLGARRGAIVLTGFVVSLGVESWQYVAAAGRDATLSDLLANTVSAGFGATGIDLLPVLWRPGRRLARRLALSAAAFAAAVMTGTSWALQPSPAATGTLRECPPVADRLAPFSGTRLRQDVVASGEPLTVVAEATVTGVAPPRIPEWVLRQCRGSAPVAAVVVEWTRVVGHIRLRADDLRLQPVLLRTEQSVTPHDTVTLVSGADREHLWLAANRRGRAEAVSLPLDAARGWMLLLPVPRWSSPAQLSRLSGMWAGFLLLPLGFWVRRAWGRREALMLVPIGVAIALGLPSLLVGAPTPQALTLGGAMAGACLGAVLGDGSGQLARPPDR